MTGPRTAAIWPALTAAACAMARRAPGAPGQLGLGLGGGETVVHRSRASTDRSPAQSASAASAGSDGSACRGYG